MEGFIKDDWEILELLEQAGPGEVPTKALVWITPFKGKDGLALSLQGYTEEGIFKVMNWVNLELRIEGDQEGKRVGNSWMNIFNTFINVPKVVHWPTIIGS